MTDFIVTEIRTGEKTALAAALYEEQRLTELRVSSLSQCSWVGCICVGVVEQVARQIGGAFLRIGKARKVYLPLKKTMLQPSRLVTVQITKDASGRKEAVATRNLSLCGRYAVLFRTAGPLSFSAKLSEEQKLLLRKWMTDPEFADVPYRILIRTNAAWCEKSDLIEDVTQLRRQMDRILEAETHAGNGTLLYRPDPFYVTMLRDLYAKPDRVFTDLPAAADVLSHAMESDAEDPGLCQTEPVLVSHGSLSLSARYGLDSDIGKLLHRQVWLKSGAFLVIEQTEAFVSIDVNTGRCSKGKIPEETFRRINLEAAEEIARQLRLRNLSGMILIDFISMTSEDHKDELLHVMKKFMRRDHAHTEVVDLTPLGIMELVRQKTARPLAEELGARIV